MPNENSSNDPAANPQTESVSQSPVSPAAPQENEMGKRGDCSADDKGNTTTENLERDIKRGEYWLIGVNAALLIVTIVIACIYNGQLRQMRKATKATQDAALAAGNANSLASQGINQALDNSRIDQRAWIDIFASSPAAFAADQPFRTPVTVRNVGKTPAKNIQLGYLFTAIPKTAKINFDADLPMSKPSALPPNGLMILQLSPDKNAPDAPLGQPRFNVITSGDYLVYFWGTEKYDDVFGYSHWVKFCYIFNVPHKTFDLCATHNDIDTENR